MAASGDEKALAEVAVAAVAPDSTHPDEVATANEYESHSSGNALVNSIDNSAAAAPSGREAYSAEVASAPPVESTAPLPNFPFHTPTQAEAEDLLAINEKHRAEKESFQKLISDNVTLKSELEKLLVAQSSLEVKHDLLESELDALRHKREAQAQYILELEQQTLTPSIPITGSAGSQVDGDEQDKAQFEQKIKDLHVLVSQLTADDKQKAAVLLKKEAEVKEKAAILFDLQEKIQKDDPVHSNGSQDGRAVAALKPETAPVSQACFIL